MREYELRIAQKMSMKVSDLFLNNRERNTVSAKVLAAWLEIKPNRPPLYPFTMSNYIHDIWVLRGAKTMKMGFTNT